jgi:predicted metal-dependent phosphoesterase TrpH
MEEFEKNKILFRKPNVGLLKDYCVVDMHFHSKYSDGINKIPAILAHAKKLGIGIAITDHNSVKGAIESSLQNEVLTIPGVEITSKEGPHILLYFYRLNDIKDFNEKHLKPNLGKSVMYPTKLSVEDIIKIGKEYNCVISFAHPYSFGATGIYTKKFNDDKREEIISKVNTFEVINSENFHLWNLMAGIKAYNLGKSMIGGSDGHTLYHMGRVVTYSKISGSQNSQDLKLNINKMRKEFLDSIKDNKTRVIGKDIDILRKFISTTYKIKPNLRKLPRALLQSLVIRMPVLGNLLK